MRSNILNRLEQLEPTKYRQDPVVIIHHLISTNPARNIPYFNACICQIYDKKGDLKPNIDITRKKDESEDEFKNKIEELRNEY